MPEPGTSDPAAELSGAIASDVEGLDRELSEIDMLASQARTEADRHEQKRAQAAERLAALVAASPPDAKEIVEVNNQLGGLTKRAALMEAQIDVLEGKRAILARYRDGLGRLIEELRGLPPGSIPAPGTGQPATGIVNGVETTPAAIRGLVQAAQEELRRDISRAMHDGPAQSLTNIVLQAQIVDRLLERDPAAARPEVRELIAMVQRTLDATKTFIFDVRPMVLDDLGLVPTLRRMARERSRQAGLAIDFDSLGADRRLPMDLESGVFRIVDEALAVLAALAPDALSVRLDWAEDELEGHVTATFPAPPEEPADTAPKHELPPVLAAFMEPRREAPKKAAAPPPGLPEVLRRDLSDRAAAIGATLVIDAAGRELHLRLPLGAPDGEAGTA